jgi:hypothetical protein
MSFSHMQIKVVILKFIGLSSGNQKSQGEGDYVYRHVLPQCKAKQWANWGSFGAKVPQNHSTRPPKYFFTAPVAAETSKAALEEPTNENLRHFMDQGRSSKNISVCRFK